MLLIFGMICSLHLIRSFEMQQRKLFLRVLHEMKQTKNTLKRQLTLYETISINSLYGYNNNNNHVLDNVLKQFIKMGGLFQHLPDIEDDDDIDDDDDDVLDDDTQDNNDDDKAIKKTIIKKQYYQYLVGIMKL